MADGLATSYSDFYPIGITVGWLVTGIGWFVSHVQANSRESRKELRSNVEGFIKTLSELVKSSCEYYTSSDRLEQQRKSLDIYVLIEKCRRQMERFDKEKDPPKLYPTFTELYEAITGGDFDSGNRQPSEADREKCKRISSLNEKIVNCVEVWYTNRYK